MTNVRFTITAILCTAISVGCNPKLYRPEITAPERYRFDKEVVRDSSALSTEWWKMFGDTTLDSLIERAFAKNLNLETAVSRIEEARNNLRVVRAEYLPAVDLGRQAGVSYSEPGGTQQSYILETTLSWELPLFGAMRHTKEAAKANIKYTEWAYRGVRLSLAAEVATTYFTLLQYNRDLYIAQRSLQLRRESATLIDSLFRHGMSTGLDLDRAMELVYTAESDIPLYQRAIDQTLLSLNVLLGETSDEEISITATLSEASCAPMEIPVGVPSDILHGRPDVMEAYYLMEQAAANVGIARSARFPTFTLTGNGGASSGNITKLFDGSSWIGSAVLSFTEPLYRFGALKRKEAIAREQYRQYILSYKQTFLQALADVETALVSISTYREQTAHYKALVDTDREITVMTNALYMSGMSSYLDVIDAERTLYNAQMQLTNLTAQQYINYVNLFKALGGGW